MQYKIIHGIIVNVDGGLAQLGERLPYKQRVGGSSPSASTMNKRETDSNLINKAEPFFLYLLSSSLDALYPATGKAKTAGFSLWMSLYNRAFLDSEFAPRKILFDHTLALK